VFTFLQNHCSRSPRMGVHVAPEYALNSGSNGNTGSFVAVNNIETRADFFGAMKQQTDAPWFSVAENVSRNDLQGCMFNAADAANGGELSAWRDAAGIKIMQGGYASFQSIYNNPTLNINNWSVNQLVSEQNNLQSIDQQYLTNLPFPGTKPVMQLFGGVSDILNPAERIKTGCIKMGMSADCGSK
jgi:filamentous hemagglutinin